MNTATNTKTFGLTIVGADADGHNGYVRGISGHEQGFTALTGPYSKTFKTLAGATRWLAVRGYDSYGRRIDA